MLALNPLLKSGKLKITSVKSAPKKKKKKKSLKTAQALLHTPHMREKVKGGRVGRTTLKNGSKKE